VKKRREQGVIKGTNNRADYLVERASIANGDAVCSVNTWITEPMS